MEKGSSYQLELFSQREGGAGGSNTGASNQLLRFIHTYEKTLLFVICFIIIGIAAFSLGVNKGVEKGRVLPVTRIEDTMNKKVPAAPVFTPAPISPAIKTENKKQNIKVKEYIESYTIQLASYKARTHAQKEAEVLKKKGFLPVILSGDKYSILCVGKFSNKEKAKSTLAELKKKYRDCFLRRL